MFGSDTIPVVHKLTSFRTENGSRKSPKTGSQQRLPALSQFVLGYIRGLRLPVRQSRLGSGGRPPKERGRFTDVVKPPTSGLVVRNNSSLRAVLGQSEKEQG